ncbi:hypothetical protein [Kitasatospora herbaricolor]|uniref:hypothetical protein n=1 Tax=Kitasatospora herbaricolor TaxID=68217 RepID=UPI0036DED75D
MGAIVTTWRPRMLRAAVFATVCVAMSATAHFSMSGSRTALPWPALWLAFLGTAAGSWLLAGRRRGFAVVALWMTTAQISLHLLFEYASAGAGAAPQRAAAATDWIGLLLCTRDPASVGMDPDELARMAGLDPDQVIASPPGHSGMAGTAHGHDMGAMSAPSGSGSVSTMVHDLSAGMLLGHLLAALLCALLLWRGDAAVVGLFELLKALARVLVPALLLLGAWIGRPVSELRPATGAVVPVLRSAFLAEALGRRGPPKIRPAV